MFHFLLAEDNPGDVFLVRRALEEHHIPHELHVVRDGAEALAFVDHLGQPDSPRPDLILMDINLPKVDGPQVLSEFRRRPECMNTPVIVVTSSDAQSDRARLAGLGVSYYFRKPSDYDSFLRLGDIILQIMRRPAQSALSAMP